MCLLAESEDVSSGSTADIIEMTALGHKRSLSTTSKSSRKRTPIRFLNESVPQLRFTRHRYRS